MAIIAGILLALAIFSGISLGDLLIILPIILIGGMLHNRRMVKRSEDYQEDALRRIRETTDDTLR